MLFFTPGSLTIFFFFRLVPILYGGVIPYWIARDHLQSLSNQNLHLYSIPNKNIAEVSVRKDSKSFTTSSPSKTEETDSKNKISISKIKTNDKLLEKNALTPMNPINVMINDLTAESLKSTPSLAPYRFHPLLNFLRQRINLGNSKVIEVKNDKSEAPTATTTLILKPVAKSVAGVDGKAIANPISRAALRRGVNADILFEPEAVAIAGPGGIAHAESDLEIYYEEDPEEKS